MNVVIDLRIVTETNATAGSEAYAAVTILLPFYKDVTILSAKEEKPAVQDVRAHGAVGDGVTDDAPAINAAMTAALEVAQQLAADAERRRCMRIVASCYEAINASCPGATVAICCLPSGDGAARARYKEHVETKATREIEDSTSSR